MLKVKGMSVFPAELEAVLVRHPAVLSCAVVGRSDGERGQVPVAFHPPARSLAGATHGAMHQASLTAWCRELMAGYKVPQIRLVDALPLTGTGKVRKDQLTAWAEQGIAAAPT